MASIDLIQSISERLRQLAEDEARRRAKLDLAYASHGRPDWQSKYARVR